MGTNYYVFMKGMVKAVPPNKKEKMAIPVKMPNKLCRIEN